MRRLATVGMLALASVGVLVTAADNDGTPVVDDTAAAGSSSGSPNPNYEQELARLKSLCKRIATEMREVFALKQNQQQEMAIMSYAADLGEHLDKRHGEWRTQHYKDWTCKQAREALDHENAKKFMAHFENWYNGRDLKPPVSHAKAVELVSHLKTEMYDLRLMNEETEKELDDIIGDLNHLEKWHLALKESYDELMKDRDSDKCEGPFHRYMGVLHELHSDHVPEWFHLSEGTALLHEQCKEDPQLNEDL